MFYSIRHITRFAYSAPISESVMEVRMQPRSEWNQRCLRFDLMPSPKAKTFSYRDHLGNVVHHFDMPARHSQLKVTAEAVVEVAPSTPLPDAIPEGTWDEVDKLSQDGTCWDWLVPSDFARPTNLLQSLAGELGIKRRADPLSLLRELNSSIHEAFEYVPQSTRVDSPIDEALAARKGVCQDFAHIMIAMVRGVGIPCRYVSGYLFHREGDSDRSAADATHAWLEAMVPQVGWVGFDPTNNLTVGERHVRVAVGRDYADVPPTRGIFRGKAETTLGVGVRVSTVDDVPADIDLVEVQGWQPEEVEESDDDQQQQQQQQQ
jgi:transglutaminase-like putative cysteine protease